MSTGTIARDQCREPERSTDEVGGRIVGEVLVGIFDADQESFRSVDRFWRPTLPSHEPGRFGIADILVPAE